MDLDTVRRWSTVLGLVTAGALLLSLVVGSITTSGPLVLVRPVEGFGPSEPNSGTTARWIEGDGAVIELTARKRVENGQLRLVARSFLEPRALVATVEGRAAGRRVVGAARYRLLVFPLGGFSPGVHRVQLRLAPGARSIAEALGTTDPRSVSIQVREPMIVTGVPR